jgi:hypothetical protein
MTPNLAEIFLKSSDVGSFRASVLSLNGEFRFDHADMMALGQAYFSCHPDREGERDLDAVRLGYQLVRIVVAEILTRGFPPRLKDFFRAAFQDPAGAAVQADAWLAEDAAALRGALQAAGAALDVVKAEIDQMPKGMIKERFVGGISLFSNVLFLLKMKAGRP